MPKCLVDIDKNTVHLLYKMHGVGGYRKRSGFGQHAPERRGLGQNHCSDDREDQFGQHVLAVIDDRIDKRICPAVGHPDVENQRTGDKV